MKKLFVLLAVIGLTGCVAYGVPYGSADVYYGSSTYHGGSPYYGPYYGSSMPYVVEQRPVYIYGSGGYTYSHRHGRRDRDRDGIPDRWDRDRDGDGVRNRDDAYPRDPRRH